MSIASTIIGPLTGRTLEVKDGKVTSAKTNVVKFPKGKKSAPKKATAKPGKKITLITKTSPARKGTVRAKRWAKLKTGMTLVACREAGIPLRYLKKMAKAKHLKIG